MELCVESYESSQWITEPGVILGPSFETLLGIPTDFKDTGNSWYSNGQDSMVSLIRPQGSIPGQGTEIPEVVWHGKEKKKRPKCLPETYSHCTGCDLWLLIWSHLSLVSGLATWSPLALHTQQVPSTTGPLHIWFSLSGMPSCHFSLPLAGGLSQAPQLQESDHVPPLLHSPMAHTSRNKDGCTHLYNGSLLPPPASH